MGKEMKTLENAGLLSAFSQHLCAQCAVEHLMQKFVFYLHHWKIGSQFFGSLFYSVVVCRIFAGVFIISNCREIFVHSFCSNFSLLLFLLYNFVSV